MEAGSLAIGIVALAGLFNNALDCFEYVQLGRGFSTNFQTSLLKLDNARLRLSRWGESVGLTGELENTQSQQVVAVATEDTPKAEEVLGQILELFANAEGISMKYKIRADENDSHLSVLDPNTNMDTSGQTLHKKMRDLAIRRQNKTFLRQKVKWALYEEKHFKRLIEDITDLVNDLVQLFPAVQQEQRRLCGVEVSEIGTAHSSLPILKDIAASQDKDLENAIVDFLKSNGIGGSTFNNYNSKISQQIGTVHIHGAQTFNIS
ncbi:prion-inhibition and propagation-domain-containing protein [Pyrenochaeta sp. MPI-SDFR-AT-0127]|nr:prion-inhibition and propagation-domain-containing protein [Pyrenochaeta sp. MPI-SDFR-AT-0127]